MNKHKLAILISTVVFGFSNGVKALTSAPTEPIQGRAPTLVSVAFDYEDRNNNGRVDIGDTLKLVGDGFSDPDMDEEVVSEFRWYRNGVVNPDATGDSYTLTSADFGTVITAGIIPQTDASITEPYKGEEVLASSGSPDADGSVDVVEAIEVDNVEIVLNETGESLVGNPIVGSVLKAKVTTSSGDVGVASNYTYQWMREDIRGSGNFTAIAGATAETYTPSKDDQKFKLQVTVIKN
ncbi:hypothetical protein GL270_09295 [Aeromonas veronii]|uniref:ZirU family protein n=1 Tax=Aeromonas veronii TaxID=654 RepID=UPI001C5A6679|nr:ZirU family protein [Aeromonas veronii]MBW3781441.1 hypothetical protein [Aeromonas veronii]